LWLGPVYAFFIAGVGLFGSYFGELYPTRVRATGAGFCFNVGRGVSAFAPVLFGGLAQMVGLQFALGLCGALFLLAGLAMFFMPNSESLAQKHWTEDEAARQLAPRIAAGLASQT
jgi:MFS family permease